MVAVKLESKHGGTLKSVLFFIMMKENAQTKSNFFTGDGFLK